MKWIIWILLLPSSPSFARDADSSHLENSGQVIAESSHAGLNDAFAIGKDVLALLKLRALNGDGRAAGKIARYFGFYKNNPVEEKLWLQVSAEDGLPGGQYEFAQRLYHEGQGNAAKLEADGKERACFWLRSANNGGYGQVPRDLEMESYCKSMH